MPRPSQPQRGRGGFAQQGERRGIPLSDLDPTTTEASRKVIGASIEVHRTLGPGFDASLYAKALKKELTALGVKFVCDHVIPVKYKDDWALIRRGAPERPVVLTAGDLSLDPAERRVARAGTPVSLTPREFALLEFLLRNRGQAMTKTAIIENVWDAHFNGDPNIVEVYVGYLRKKIDHPFGRAAIETVRGAGYRVAADGG